MPAVSVVLATYNQAHWLAETIESVRAQTFADWEVVIADDGSTDATAEVVGRFARDHRIRCIAGAHAERAAARNRAIAASTGELVAFLDADDTWQPEKLARQVAALAAAPEAGACYTIARFVDGAGGELDVRKPPRALSGLIFPRLVRGNFIILASMMVRRRCLEAVGAFDATLPVFGCEDWDLWLRLARRYAVVAVDEELVRYRVHEANTRPEQVMTSGLAVLDRLYADPGVEREAGIGRAAARARHVWYHAAIVAARDRGTAIPLVGRALREHPPTLFSRPAAGALAAVGLPRVVERALRVLPL
jgi:glycosyltransferase involved in cell wall biosynthesis